MKKIAAVLLVVAFSSVSAFGGVVSFTPTSPDPWGNALDGPTTQTFDVMAESTMLPGGVVGSINMDIGSDSGLDVSFVHALPWTLASVDDPGRGVFANDVFLDGVDFGAGSTPSFLLGVLTVDANGLAPGLYSYGVGGQFGFSAERDPIEIGPSMGGMVNVVPEPASLSLLALGALGLIRRRKA